MKPFRKIFIEQVFKKLDKFDQFKETIPELKVAHDLCIRIEKLYPGSEALIVGGAVRDLIQGKAPHDFDIATNVDVESLKQHFKLFDIGGKKFNTIGVSFEGYHFEVANFRVDEKNPESRKATKTTKANTFKEDSARRDLTINSLGLNTKGEIEDYQNGIEDIKNNLIRTVGRPEDRYQEDPLRILRTMRFSAKLGWNIEDNTKKVTKELASTALKVSIERITDELKKASSSGKSLANYIRLLDDNLLLQPFLPEIKALQKFEHNPIHHPEGNVFEHTMKALESSKTNDPLTNLSILFHDIGKATTAGIHPDTGQPTYHGHEEQSTVIFENLARRLKFSNDEIDAIKYVVANHMRAYKMGEMSKNKALQIRQSPYWDMLKQVMIADQLARGGSLAELETQFQNVEQMIKTFGEKQVFEKRISALINGNMIINIAKELGYVFNKTNAHYIGDVKNQLRDIIIKKAFNVSSEEIAEEIKQKLNLIFEEKPENEDV